MRTAITLMGICLLTSQQEFEAASVKTSEKTVGPDYGNRISRSPTGFSARNTTLKRLIAEAYHLQAFQIAGGPPWLNNTEYDVTARHPSSTTEAEVETMLQMLLTDRFHLKTHRESRETKVYMLKVEKNGPKVTRGTGTNSDAVFHGGMQQFASFLSMQLTIPVLEDPSKPGMASGPPVPILDETGLSGEYDIDVIIHPEPGTDMFTLWQRALRDELGLRLESSKAQVAFLIVDNADKTPVSN